MNANASESLVHQFSKEKGPAAERIITITPCSAANCFCCFSKDFIAPGTEDTRECHSAAAHMLASHVEKAKDFTKSIRHFKKINFKSSVCAALERWNSRSGF